MKKPYRFSSESVLPLTYESDVNFWLDTVDFMIQFFSLRIDLLSIFDYMDKFSLENLQTSRHGALILFEELEFDWTERFLEKCRKFSRRAALAKSAKTSIIILDGLRKLLQSNFPVNSYFFCLFQILLNNRFFELRKKGFNINEHYNYLFLISEEILLYHIKFIFITKQRNGCQRLNCF